MQYLDFNTIDWSGRRVLVRADLNVPMGPSGDIVDQTRLIAILPTLKTILASGGLITLVSHRGRPTAGQFNPDLSMAPLRPVLRKALECEVEWCPHWPYSQPDFKDTSIALVENCRFLKGETTGDTKLSDQMAQLQDYYVMDAFGCAHRQHASVAGIAQSLNHVCLGPLMQKEYTMLDRLKEGQHRPTLLVVGGAKIASKLPVIESLSSHIDAVLFGGGVANTCLAAQGFQVGASLMDEGHLDSAQNLLSQLKSRQVKVYLPDDVMVKSDLIKPVHSLLSDEAIFDIGNKTQSTYRSLILNAQTVIWMGPLGWYEQPPFDQGSQSIAQAMVDTSAFTVLGGGDTVACFNHCFPNALNSVNWISTGGGAFLAGLAGQLVF